MREILFRGKHIDGYGWETGDLIHNGDDRFTMTFIGGIAVSHDTHTDEISFDGHWLAEVDPATVGQYTGLKDRNGVRIFEGDVVRCKHFYNDYDGTFESAKIRSAYGKAFDKTTGEPTYLRNYAVRMYGGSWELRNGSDGHKINSNYIINHEIEVIGNVHDDPALLEV